MNEQVPVLEDKIARTLSIADPVLLLWRRKYLIAFVVLIAAGLGAVSAWRSPPLYRYTCGFQVGEIVYRSRSNIIRVTSLQRTPSVIAKLNETYIPAAIEKYSAAHPGKSHSYVIRATATAGSSVVYLRATGPKTSGVAYIAIMKSAADNLIANDRLLAAPVREEYQAVAEKERIELRKLKSARVFLVQVLQLRKTIQQAESNLIDLKGQEAVLGQRVDRQKVAVKLVNDEIQRLSQVVREQDGARRQAASKATGPSEAMTLMLLDSVWERAAKRLSELRQRREVDLPVQARVLVAKIATDQRAQGDQEAKLVWLRASLASLHVEHGSRIAEQEQEVALLDAQARQVRYTALLQAPARSAYPVGPSRRGRIVLAGIAGLILGVLMAFAAEVVTDLRTRRL